MYKLIKIQLYVKNMDKKNTFMSCPYVQMKCACMMRWKQKKSGDLMGNRNCPYIFQ